MSTNDNLDNRIVKLEETIKQLKTSQATGQSTSILIKIADIDLSASVKTDAFFVFKFVANDVIGPLVMPRVKVYFNGNLIDGQIDYNRYNILSSWTDQTAFTNPYLTGFQIGYDSYTYRNGTLRVVGEVLANCYGVVKQQELIVNEF